MKPTLKQRLNKAYIRSKIEPCLFGKSSQHIIILLNSGLLYFAGLIGLVSFLKIDTQKLQFLTFDNFLISCFAISLLVMARIVAFIYDLGRYFWESRPVSRSDVTIVRTVLPSTQRFIETKGLGNHAYGCAIEIFTHPFVDRNLRDNGWECTEIDMDTEKGFTDSSKFVDKNQFVSGENGAKFFLRRFEQPFVDNSKRLNLTLGRTDWINVINTRDKLAADEQLRHSSIDVQFQLNSVPSSFCLQFVCLTKDFEFLALKRHEDAAYHPKKMSISFEEQLATEDIERAKESRVEAWFQRALCEEVFPLVGLHKRNPAAAWDAISDAVIFKRIWSCFLEEDTGNISLMGVTQLNLTATELVSFSRQLETQYKSRRDNEGRLFVFRKDNILDLLQTGRAECRSLFNSSHTEFVSEMHPTSLYRAAGVMACLQD